MSPGERVASGRREPARPQYAATAPGFPPPYYPAYGVPHNAWLGAPLISMAGRAPNSRHAPVTKLAVHAQGAPLIIQNRNERRRFITCPEQLNTRPSQHNDNVNRDRCEPSETNRARNQQQQVRLNRGGRNNNADAISVASDESSGSANSETMLPRIIKPRKRRKKDRKPNNIAGHDLTATLELGDVDHSSISGVVTSGNIYDESYCRGMSLPYHLNIKVLEYQEPAPETYRVSALGEALEATQFGLAEAASPAESATSSCQCRYCDPVGQIWDTVSIADLLNENSSGDFTPTKLEDSMKVVGPLGRRGTDTTLRRSWSDPSSRVPDRRETSSNGDTVSAPNLYSLFPPSRRASSPEPRSPLALEISSEIVTSINGHRDLEIKLFSSSPPTMNYDRRSFFGDNNESVLKSCSDTSQIKVDNVVTSDEVAASVNKYKSENVSGCLTSLTVDVSSRNNVSDVALVTT